MSRQRHGVRLSSLILTHGLAGQRFDLITDSAEVGGEILSRGPRYGGAGFGGKCPVSWSN